MKFVTSLPGGLEYRGRLANGDWTDWTAQGDYTGTKEQRESPTGFAARLTGPLSLAYDCLCIASFKERDDLIITQSGAPCAMKSYRQLETMQVIFRPRAT